MSIPSGMKTKHWLFVAVILWFPIGSWSYWTGKRAADRWWQAHQVKCEQPTMQRRQMLCAGDTCVDDMDNTWICEEKGCKPFSVIKKP